MSKEQEIRDFILSLGVDDEGFADIRDYKSPRTDDVMAFISGRQSIYVL